ncbi:MAG TPA: hypothetical protein VMV46_18965 [Thermoanaerobaculia bacterium]|nr:hypothetical protein [Thermoanaerobaculia bacterium]
MGNRTRILGALATALVVVTLAGPLRAQPEGAVRTTAEAGFAPNGPCRVAGTFLVTAPAFLPDVGDQPLLAVVTIAPSDPTCRRFAISLVPVNPELSFAGIFPEAVLPPGLFGSILRDEGGYGVYAIAHSPGAPPEGVPIRGRVLYFWTYQGTVSCPDDECFRLLLDGVASLYSSIDDPAREVPELGIFGVRDQDRDEDGFADPDEAPILVAPFQLPGRRVIP